MINFLGAAAAPRIYNLLDNVPDDIVQPTEPILQYCCVSKTKNNFDYLCKLCGYKALCLINC